MMIFWDEFGIWWDGYYCWVMWFGGIKVCWDLERIVW